MNNVTIFKNIRSTETPFHKPMHVVLDRIKDGKSRDLIKSIRAEKDKGKRNELKKLLPALCFSGEFNKRLDNGIVSHSGFICLDFDNYEKTKDMQADKAKLSKDKYVYSVFVSPSGKGLKAIVKIPAVIDDHVGYFNALEDYFDSPYFDTTSKNISRVCYESYDKLIYINEESVLWDKLKENDYVEVIRNSDYMSIPITDESKIIDILVKWWERKYPMSEGTRNQNAYILSMALNEYGIQKGTASYILNGYQSSGFDTNEIQQTVNSAYSNTDKFNTKFYEDESKLNEIKVKVRNGSSRNEIIKDISTGSLSVEAIDSVLSRLSQESNNPQFWTKSDKGVVRVVPVLFKTFLEDSGFHKFCPESGTNYVFVRIMNNLIDNSSEQEIKDFVLEYLLGLDDLSIYNYFAERVSMFKEAYLTLLSTVDIYFVIDTKDVSYLYYENCAIKITVGNIEPIDYLELDGYVWREHVIQRNFSMCEVTNCDFKTFIGNICNNDDGRIGTMESTIGYMMHGYKNLSYCPAIILGDEEISDDPEGGTGKGLFMNALSQMKKLVVIDGKSFNFEKSFPYQTVSADTQILCFDDVKKHFDFERLFSVITEGLTLEKKNKDAIKIPFKNSPKVSITTNYAIEGSGNSFARRKWEIELHKCYTKDNTPYDEFGRHFFEEWDVEQYCQFDMYMVGCLRTYMKTGLIESDFVNKKMKKLQEKTSRNFIEWAGLLSGDVQFLLQEGKVVHFNIAYNNFIEEYYGKSKHKSTVSRNKFNKWIESYVVYTTGKELNTGRDGSGRWYLIERH